MPTIRQASRPLGMFTGPVDLSIRIQPRTTKACDLLGSQLQRLAKRNSDAAYVVVNRNKSKPFRPGGADRDLWGRLKTMSNTKEAILARVYGARSNDDLAEGYDGWAGAYDGDMEQRGYRLPGIVAALTARHVGAEDRPLLDAGAGSGLLGIWLKLLGYDAITGIDLSRGMLDLAAATGAYTDLARMTLGEPLDFADGAFAAVVSTGTFGATHAPAAGFDELVRITRPGGHLILSVRAKGMEDAGFPAALERLEQAGAWRRIGTTGPFQAMRNEPESLYVVHVCRKPG